MEETSDWDGESKLVWQIAPKCEAVSWSIWCSCQTKDLDCKCCRLGQIFHYFIQHPDVYTQQQLVQWKSLDAYKYIRSGHVREVRVWVTSKTCCFLMAYMNPSQSTPDRTGRLSLPTAPVHVCLGKSNQVQSVPSSLRILTVSVVDSATLSATSYSTLVYVPSNS